MAQGGQTGGLLADHSMSNQNQSFHLTWVGGVRMGAAELLKKAYQPHNICFPYCSHSPYSPPRGHVLRVFEMWNLLDFKNHTRENLAYSWELLVVFTF